MMTSEQSAQLRLIQLLSKKLARGLLIGGNRSSLYGSGFDFDQIRDYQEGDDVRSIEWKTTARMNKVMIKQCKEERMRTILVAVDLSASMLFGASSLKKEHVVRQLAGMIASVGAYADDKVGLILFTDQVETYIPAQQGQKALRHLLDILVTFKPKGTKTKIEVALEAIERVRQRDMLLVIISDFIGLTSHSSLMRLAAHHDVIGLCVMDPLETHLPQIGYMHVRDSESKQDSLLDLRDPQLLNTLLHNRYTHLEDQLKGCGVDHAVVSTHESVVKQLVQIFKKRKKR